MLDLIQVCKKDDCTANAFKFGHCYKHQPDIILKETCRITDCDNDVHIRKLCEKHSKETCKIKECDNVIYSRKLCQKHSRIYTVDSPDIPKVCIHPGCNNFLYCLDVCEKHYKHILKRNVNSVNYIPLKQAELK